MENKETWFYLAGPMTGIPQFNFPRFFEVADKLRDKGYMVLNPAENDTDAVREAALASVDGALGSSEKLGGESWGDMLARDVKIVADKVDAVVALENWYTSRGARLEVFVALTCNKPVYLYQDCGPLFKMDPVYLVDRLQTSLLQYVTGEE